MKDSTTYKCQDCGTTEYVHQLTLLCDDCDEKRQRKQLFDRICPPTMRTIDSDLLPEAAKAPLTDLLSWKHAPRGIILHGETATGKTRSLWALFRKLCIDDKLSVHLIKATEFARSVSREFHDIETFDVFLRTIRNVDALGIDDLGKERMTPRVETELFDLIDYRLEYGRPTFITTNYKMSGLKQRFSDQDTAEPFCRRLRESFDFIHF